MRRSRTSKGRRFTLHVEILPDKLFNRLHSASDDGMWDVDTNTISLRESRHDPDLYADWLHEARHVYTDRLAPGEP